MHIYHAFCTQQQLQFIDFKKQTHDYYLLSHRHEKLEKALRIEREFSLYKVELILTYLSTEQYRL